MSSFPNHTELLDSEISVENLCTKFASSYIKTFLKHNFESKKGSFELGPCISTTFGAVLMADVSGYSKLSSILAERGTIGSETLHNIMKAYLDKIIAIIQKHGGDVVKFAGDAIVVVWRLAETVGSNENSNLNFEKGLLVLKAAKCSIELLTELGSFDISNILKAAFKDENRITSRASATLINLDNSAVSEFQQSTLSLKLQKMFGNNSAPLQGSRQRQPSVVEAIKHQSKISGTSLNISRMSRQSFSEKASNSKTAEPRSQTLENVSESQAVFEPPKMLRIHLGIGAGTVCDVVVGSVSHKRFEHFIAGEGVEQLGVVLDLAKPGELALSHSGLQFLKYVVDINTITLSGYSKKCIILQGLDRARITVERTLVPQKYPELKLDPIALTALKFFINDAALRKLENDIYSQGLFSKDHDLWSLTHLVELRQVTTMFIKIDALSMKNAALLLSHSQLAICRVLDVLEIYHGSLRQFHVDDKGALILCFFGLPPFANNNDAANCSLAALRIQESFLQLFSEFSIGLSTGLITLGAVGSSDRLEYALLGDAINMAARLMCLPQAKCSILCDSKSFALKTENSLSEIHYSSLGTKKVKGKPYPIQVYQLSKLEEGASDCEKLGQTSITVIGREKEKGAITEIVFSIKEESTSETLKMRNFSLKENQTPSKTALDSSGKNIFSHSDASEKGKSLSSRLLLIEGEAGQGVTGLMRFTAQKCLMLGFKVVECLANELNSSTSFSTVRILLYKLLDVYGNTNAFEYLIQNCKEDGFNELDYFLKNLLRNSSTKNDFAIEKLRSLPSNSNIGLKEKQINCALEDPPKKKLSSFRSRSLSLSRKSIEDVLQNKTCSVTDLCDSVDLNTGMKSISFKQEFVRDGKILSGISNLSSKIVEDCIGVATLTIQKLFESDNFKASNNINRVLSILPRYLRNSFSARFGDTGTEFLPIDSNSLNSDDLAELFVALLALVTASGYPVCVHIEEIQWLDEASLQVILKAAKKLPAATLITISTTTGSASQNSYLENWILEAAKLPALKTMILSGLDLPETENLLKYFLATEGMPVDEIDAELLEVIWTASSGKPMHTNLILINLIEAGLLETVTKPQENALQESLSIVEQLELSDTVLKAKCHITVEMCLNDINASVNTVFDRLDNKLQLLLKIGAVLGTRFSFKDAVYVLAQTSGWSKQEIGALREDALYDLFTGLDKYKYLTRANSPETKGEIILEFSNVVIRESILRNMSSTQKANIHESLARVLETKLSPSTLDYILPKLESHYYLALQYEKLDLSSSKLYMAACRYCQGLGQLYYDIKFWKEAEMVFAKCLTLVRQNLEDCEVRNQLIKNSSVSISTKLIAARLKNSSKRTVHLDRVDIPISKTSLAPIVSKIESYYIGILDNSIAPGLSITDLRHSESLSATFILAIDELKFAVNNQNWDLAHKLSLSCLNLVFQKAYWSYKHLALCHAVALYTNYLNRSKHNYLKSDQLEHFWANLAAQSSIFSILTSVQKFQPFDFKLEIISLNVLFKYYIGNGSIDRAYTLLRQLLVSIDVDIPRIGVSKQGKTVMVPILSKRLVGENKIHARLKARATNSLAALNSVSSNSTERFFSNEYSERITTKSTIPVDPMLQKPWQIMLLADSTFIGIVVDLALFSLFFKRQDCFPNLKVLCSIDMSFFENESYNTWFAVAINSYSSEKLYAFCWVTILQTLSEIDGHEFDSTGRAFASYSRKCSTVEKLIEKFKWSDPYLNAISKIAKLTVFYKFKHEGKQKYNSQILEIIELLFPKTQARNKLENKSLAIFPLWCQRKSRKQPTKLAIEKKFEKNAIKKLPQVSSTEAPRKWLILYFLLRRFQTLLSNSDFTSTSQIFEASSMFSSIVDRVILPCKESDQTFFSLVEPISKWSQSLQMQLKFYSLHREELIKRGQDVSVSNIQPKLSTLNDFELSEFGRNIQSPGILAESRLAPTFSMLPFGFTLTGRLYSKKKKCLIKALKHAKEALLSLQNIVAEGSKTELFRVLDATSKHLPVLLAAI